MIQVSVVVQYGIGVSFSQHAVTQHGIAQNSVKRNSIKLKCSHHGCTLNYANIKVWVNDLTIRKNMHGVSLL